MEDRYVIISLNSMDFMKDKDGNVGFYNSEQEAARVCGMYELEDVWICKLIRNYK